ncbi:MAG TPA: Hpt domain-containing protein [Terracidiphilus sp.]|jgi:HPt (histidine-containing phosphotransfer) domain-containing protein
MGEDASNAFAQAMNLLWAKHLPQMTERVETLEKAAESLANGTLTQAGQQQAAAEAHKLAGVLGTFGLKEGTELAREAEGLYESALDRNSSAASRLAAIAEQLHVMITNRR